MTVASDLDFDALFRAEFPKLVAIGFGMTGNREVARDLAQETMARAHRHWGSMADIDVPEAWLRTVMKNLTTDHFRRAASERAAVKRLSTPSVEERATSPESRLAEFVAVLPERQREVVVLFYVDDLSVAQTARVLDMAEGTVKSMLWKARRRLKNYLKEVDND